MIRVRIRVTVTVRHQWKEGGISLAMEIGDKKRRGGKARGKIEKDRKREQHKRIERKTQEQRAPEREDTRQRTRPLPFSLADKSYQDG